MVSCSFLRTVFKTVEELQIYCLLFGLWSDSTDMITSLFLFFFFLINWTFYKIGWQLNYTENTFEMNLNLISSSCESFLFFQNTFVKYFIAKIMELIYIQAYYEFGRIRQMVKLPGMISVLEQLLNMSVMQSDTSASRHLNCVVCQLLKWLKIGINCYYIFSWRMHICVAKTSGNPSNDFSKYNS